jgi:hypothetical protein
MDVINGINKIFVLSSVQVWNIKIILILLLISMILNANIVIADAMNVKIILITVLFVKVLKPLLLMLTVLFCILIIILGVSVYRIVHNQQTTRPLGVGMAQ